MPFIKEEDITFTNPPQSNFIDEKDVDFFEEPKTFGVSGGFPEPERGILPAFKKGLKSSIPGLLATQEIQEPLQDPNILERTAQSAGQIAGDLPVFVAGGVIGGTVGAFALPAGIRSVLVDAYSKGTAKTFADFKERAAGAVFETVKGGLVGGSVGLAGKVPGIAKVPAELLALTGVGAGVEGQIPTAQDFIDSAILLGGLKGVSKTSKALRNHYAKTGETPTKVADRLKPAIAKKKAIDKVEPPKRGSNIDDLTDAINKTSDTTLPKYAGSINLKRQRIKKEAKVVELKLSQELIPRKVVTHKQTIAEGKKVMEKFINDPAFMNKRLKEIKNGSPTTRGENQAFREMNASNLDFFTQAVKKVTKGEITQKEFQAIEKKVKSMQLEIVDPLASEAGRVLNAFNIEVGKRRVQNMLFNNDKIMNKRQQADFIDLVSSNGFSDPRRVKNFIDRYPNPKISEYIYEYWYNSILSGPPTHLVNAITNTAYLAYLPVKRVAMGAVDAINPERILKGEARRVYASEAIPMLAGYAKGFVPGVKGGAQTIWYGIKDADQSKWARDIGLGNVSAFERSPYKIFNNRASVLANTAALRALQAMDILPRSMAGEAQLRALAHRKALNAGLKGKKRIAFEQNIVENTPDNIRKMAAEFADHAVFMDKPGKFTKWAMNVRNIVPGIRLQIPFVNTISNLTQRGLEKTLGIGLGLEWYRKQSKQKRLPVEEVIVNQLEGAAIALYMLYKAEQGEITGAVPRNPAERDAFYRQGKIPWSIRVGEDYISYRRIEPLNTPLAFTAVAYEAIKNADDEDTATEIFGRVGANWLDNFIDTSYFSGISSLLDKHGRRKGMINRLAASFVPYSSFNRSINRAIEVGLEGSTKVRDTSSLLGAFTQVIPGLYNLAEPRLNVWGEEIELPGGIFRQWLPYKWSAATTDPVEIELEKLGYHPGLPGRNVTINKVDVTLPENIYRDYSMAYGKKAKDMMKATILKPSFQALPEQRKMEILDRRLRIIKTPLLKRAKIEFRKQGGL